MAGAADSPGPIRVDKHGRGPPLPAPVRRIFYLSAEGTGHQHEVFPPPNPRLLAQVDAADAIVYGMGSLYTSICPSLVLQARTAISTSLDREPLSPINIHRHVCPRRCAISMVRVRGPF